MPVVPISVCTLPKKSDAGGKVTQPKKWVCVFPAGVARRWQFGVYHLGINFDAGGKVAELKKWVCVFPAGVARRWQCGVYSSEKIGRRR